MCINKHVSWRSPEYAFLFDAPVSIPMQRCKATTSSDYLNVAVIGVVKLVRLVVVHRLERCKIDLVPQLTTNGTESSNELSTFL